MTTKDVWQDMIDSCTVKTHPRFNETGARGVKVCTEWQSYDGFIADMGEVGAIELIDKRGKYCKENVSVADVKPGKKPVTRKKAEK